MKGKLVNNYVMYRSYCEQSGGSGEARSSGAAGGRLWKPESEVRVAASPRAHGIPSALQSGELPTGSRQSYKIQQRSELKPALGEIIS